MESTNGHPRAADDDLASAFDAFDGAGHGEEPLYGYDPQVLYDDETGDVRIIVVVPVDGGEAQIHIPLDDEGMVEIVNGLAEARGVQPRTAAPARGPQLDSDEAPGGGARSAVRRMVDPAGISKYTPDDLPDTILGVPAPRMIAYILGLVLVISFLLAVLL